MNKQQDNQNQQNQNRQQSADKGNESRNNQNLSSDERSKGGQQAAQTAKEKYGEDFHSKIGKEGGQSKNKNKQDDNE